MVYGGAVTDVARAELRNQRRATRRAQSRAEIVDAAERVFSEDGLRNGSLRRIADLSGYSTAAIYKFFDSRQHLVAETLNRRADEYLGELRRAAESAGTPLERLHLIVDNAAAYFLARGHFRSLLRQMQGGSIIVGPGNGDPYPEHQAAIEALARRFLLSLDRARCFPYAKD